ncbi:hypothetical protein D3Z51_16700 [Clostridiaceae bacterium]|nr:hypothetical protein [Clostridiaceae bacterium]RKI10176.1 hypothetical protein D7V81_16160 [bacterium 1XD21-70]
MNGEQKIDVEAFKYILIGIVMVAVLAFFVIHPIKVIRYDREPVEVQVVGKEIADMDGGKQYLLHCMKADGEQETLELHEKSIGERFERETVYKQIRKGKYYKFNVAMKEEFGSHYRTVCGAVKLINGYTLETAAQ